MKRTQWKDAWRNIIRQKVSYLSVILIAMLGAGSFLSMSYASDSMKNNCSEEDEKMRFRNIEVVSTSFITSEDLDKIRNVNGVSDAEPVWLANSRVIKDDISEDAAFISLTERINIPLIREGTLPQTESECAVWATSSGHMKWSMTADSISLPGSRLRSLP